MASNNIDFVIGAKDQAKPALSSVEKSLDRLVQKTAALGQATLNLSSLAGGLAAAYGLLKASMGIVGVIDNINAAYDEAAGNTGVVAEMNDRASSAINRLMVAVGTILAPMRALVSAGLEALSNALSTVLTPAVESAKAALENIGPLMDYVRDKVVAGVNAAIGAFTFFEVVLTNLDSVWTIVVAQAELYMIQMAEAIGHTLTVVIPAYAEWFADNFVNIFKDAFNAVVAIVTNAGKILGEAIYQIFAFIASGGDGGIEGLMSNLGHAASMSLLDGFESSLTALPDIAERAITDREKDLTATIGTIGGNLGDEFNRKMEERMIGASKSLGDQIIQDIEAKTAEATQTTKKASGGQSLQASESRLITRGSASDPMDKTNRILAAIEKQDAENAKIYAQQLEASRAIAANTAGGKTNLVPIA